MRYCRNCGGETGEGDIYCGYCGSKLIEYDPLKDERGNSDFLDDGVGIYDFDSDFDENFDKELNVDFDDEFAKYDEFGNSEFESQAESNNYNLSDANSNGDDNGHKQLMPNKFAKDAETFGILSLIFGIFGGVLGIVFGIIGLTKCKKALELCNTGEYDGYPKASNAKILSIMGIVIGALRIVTYILRIIV